MISHQDIVDNEKISYTISEIIKEPISYIISNIKDYCLIQTWEGDDSVLKELYKNMNKSLHIYVDIFALLYNMYKKGDSDSSCKNSLIDIIENTSMDDTISNTEIIVDTTDDKDKIINSNSDTLEICRQIETDDCSIIDTKEVEEAKSFLSKIQVKAKTNTPLSIGSKFSYRPRRF